MIVLGIDPGLTGALAVVHSERGLLDTVDLPVCENGTAGGSMRRWLDCAGLGVLLIDLSARHQFALESVEAAMERPIPMPSLPAQTIATQFDTVGALRGILAARAIPLTMVEPVRWKRAYGLRGGKDAKHESRMCCLRLYPRAPVGRVKDHNRAEAILIADWLIADRYGRRERARDDAAAEWARAA